MDILLLLIPLSLIFIIAAVFAFRWAIKSRQFEDLESPGMIPLLDDDPIEAKSDPEQNQQNQKPS